MITLCSHKSNTLCIAVVFWKLQYINLWLKKTFRSLCFSIYLQQLILEKIVFSAEKLGNPSNDKARNKCYYSIHSWRYSICAENHPEHDDVYSFFDRTVIDRKIHKNGGNSKYFSLHNSELWVLNSKFF